MKRPQSLAGYIRQHLDELETHMEFGIRQEVLVAELEAKGFKTTLKGFRNFLYRARLRAAAKSVQSRRQPTGSADATTVALPAAQPTAKAPDNPLTKSKGFEFHGTSGIDQSELI